MTWMSMSILFLNHSMYCIFIHKQSSSIVLTVLYCYCTEIMQHSQEIQTVSQINSFFLSPMIMQIICIPFLQTTQAKRLHKTHAFLWVLSIQQMIPNKYCSNKQQQQDHHRLRPKIFVSVDTMKLHHLHFLVSKRVFLIFHLPMDLYRHWFNLSR